MAVTGILTRAFGLVLIIVFFTSLLTDQIVQSRLEREALPDIRKSLEEKARLIHPMLVEALSERNYATLARQARSLARESQVGITYFSEEGLALFDSTTTLDQYDNRRDRPEVSALLENGESYMIRHSPYKKVRMMFLGRELRSPEGELLGYIRYSTDLAILQERLGHVRGSVFFAAALLALLGFIPASIFAASISRPLARINRMLDRYASGRTDVQLENHRQDEIGDLIRRLNTLGALMARRFGVMEAENKRLHALLGGMVEGVIGLDRDERIIYINSYAADLIQASVNRAKGSILWEVTRQAGLAHAVEQALAVEGEITNEARIVDEQGDRIIKVYTSRIRDADGQPAGSVIVLQDVTTLRRLAELRQDLISNVAHEFKTPLTAILGISETVLENPEMSVEQRNRFLQRVLHQTERLHHLATDVLELSRIESGSRTVEHTPQDIRPIISGVIEILRERAAKSSLSLVHHEVEDPVVVNCDADSILQITENLLDNAIKYTPKGGVVTVRIDREGLYARLIVSDTGLGIEPEERVRIFERFYRTKAARKPIFEGTGLGLAIIHSIVRSYDGDILVESEPGEGSSFVVRLPLHTVRSGL